MADIGGCGGSGVFVGGGGRLSVMGVVGSVGGSGTSCSGTISGCGFGVGGWSVVVFSEVAGLMRRRRSASIVCLGGCFLTGIKWRRNFLFRRVIRPDPSTFTRY